jgi:hypothetical protein
MTFALKEGSLPTLWPPLVLDHDAARRNGLKIRAYTLTLCLGAYASKYQKSEDMSKADILVSGATGRTGGAAIDELLKIGKRVRAYVRSDDDRSAVLRKRGVDIAIGDFTGIDDIRAAMEGISSAYFLYPIAPGIIGASAYFAQAAKEAGVTAIVNMSQISARNFSVWRH